MLSDGDAYPVPAYAFAETAGNMEVYFTETATGTGSNKLIDTTFAGSVDVWAAGSQRRLALCSAGDHRLAFVR